MGSRRWHFGPREGRPQAVTFREFVHKDRFHRLVTRALDRQITDVDEQMTDDFFPQLALPAGPSIGQAG
jgi:hypothetical protein